MVKGFSLVELMVVVAIMVLLSMLAVPNYKRFIARSKRAEAHVNLTALATAEELYYAEHGTYCDRLQGADSLGYQPASHALYSYGFAGTQGTHWMMGMQGRSLTIPSYAKANANGFVAVAIADIDGDGKPDILTIDQTRKISIISDDLQ